MESKISDRRIGQLIEQAGAVTYPDQVAQVRFYLRKMMTLDELKEQLYQYCGMEWWEIDRLVELVQSEIEEIEQAA